MEPSVRRTCWLVTSYRRAPVTREPTESGDRIDPGPFAKQMGVAQNLRSQGYAGFSCWFL